MISTADVLGCLSMCVEGFLFVAKEVQLFLGLGVYSGIFVIYLQFSSNESRTRSSNVVFYTLCLLYGFCAAVAVCDLLVLIFGLLALYALPLQLQIDLLATFNRVEVAQETVNACCEFTAQCIIIYRCWIVWGKNTRIVIIPSFLAITLLATWLASAFSGLNTNSDDVSFWPNTTFTTGLAASMAVNTLMTGMIVFRILKDMVEPTSTERSLGSTRGNKVRHIVFIIIESGMALFAIQLVRFVLAFIPAPVDSEKEVFLEAANDFVIFINQMFNGIAPTIILVRVQMRLSFDDEGSFKEAVESLRFNKNRINLNTSQQTAGSSNSMSLNSEDFEVNEVCGP